MYSISKYIQVIVTKLPVLLAGLPNVDNPIDLNLPVIILTLSIDWYGLFHELTLRYLPQMRIMPRLFLIGRLC